MKGDFARGVKDLYETLRLNPRETEAQNSRAWAAATCPDARFRDRGKALGFARQAREQDGWTNAFYLGTLAAACAENGDFGGAVRWQRKALEGPAYRKECGEEGRTTLKPFEQRRPYREGYRGRFGRFGRFLEQGTVPSGPEWCLPSAPLGHSLTRKIGQIGQIDHRRLACRPTLGDLRSWLGPSNHGATDCGSASRMQLGG